MGFLDRLLGPRREDGQPIVADSAVLNRDAQPLEGTNISMYESVIPNFWTENGLNDAGKMFWPGNGLLAERTWITNRCLQMNSQQIGSMPLKFAAPNAPSAAEPAWVSNPDPVNYPNGVSSMMRALVRDYYGWGWCLLYVTARYADGYPRNFTRVPAARCEPMWDDNGDRVYKLGERYLDPRDVIQIDRDCGDGWMAHGTSAIRSYAQLAWGLQAAGNQAMDVNQGGVPKAVLKSQRKLDSAQATKLQTQWMTRTQARNGAPPVLPPELDFETLGWSPKDMALLETQDFNALALATAFGIPAVLVNMTVGGGRGNSALTYQTPAMVGDQWWRYELRPTAKTFEDALTARCLPSGQKVWLDASDTFLPFQGQQTGQPGPSATAEDDPQISDPQQAPASASASGATVTAIGGYR